MIHFDFDDRYEDERVVGHAISPREAVLLSIIVHLCALLWLQFGPNLHLLEPSQEELKARQQRIEEQERERNRFVFVQPRVDIEAPKPPPRADLSDLNRKAQAPERAAQPTNPLPFSRGNSPERVEASPPPERARGEETPIKPDTEPPGPEPQEQITKVLPPADTGLRRFPTTSRPAPGLLGDALRNLERYVQNETFQNPQGGANEPGQTFQFDTKGIDFGPWLRRFVAQVRRNWTVPYAAMTFHGRVVLQFNIHRDGTITDVAIVGPSDIAGFNRAAQNAILGSNPTEPLPPGYPDPQAFFTVTFFYNENPVN